MDKYQLLKHITADPNVSGGKPIIRGRRLAVEHVLWMLAAGDTPETILSGYAWLKPEDDRAQEVSFTSTDGNTISGQWIPPESPQHGAVLVTNGNGGNLTHCRRRRRNKLESGNGLPRSQV